MDGSLLAFLQLGCRHLANLNTSAVGVVQLALYDSILCFLVEVLQGKVNIKCHLTVTSSAKAGCQISILNLNLLAGLEIDITVNTAQTEHILILEV